MLVWLHPQWERPCHTNDQIGQCPTGFCPGQSGGGICQINSFFPNGSSFCQVDTKLPSASLILQREVGGLGAWRYLVLVLQKSAASCMLLSDPSWAWGLLSLPFDIRLWCHCCGLLWTDPLWSVQRAYRPTFINTCELHLLFHQHPRLKPKMHIVWHVWWCPLDSGLWLSPS